MFTPDGLIFASFCLTLKGLNIKLTLSTLGSQIFTEKG